MAATATEKKLLIDGEWVETGEWVEVRSPYSGELVGRVAKAGAAEARRAIDAAEAAMREPLPAHKRAEILVRVAGYLGKRHEEVAQTISAGSTSSRPTSPFSTCPASSSPRSFERAPSRFPIGERTASTISASVAIRGA